MDCRKLLRIPGFDYSQSGAYFITICARDRRCLFADIAHGRVKLNHRGDKAAACWDDIPNHFAAVVLDAFVIMPNHVHGILLFTETVPGRTLQTVVGSFKSAVSRQIGEGVWQRNYWERVIRNEDELNRIRAYIDKNPLCWANDPENLQRT